MQPLTTCAGVRDRFWVPRVWVALPRRAVTSMNGSRRRSYRASSSVRGGAGGAKTAAPPLVHLA